MASVTPDASFHVKPHFPPAWIDLYQHLPPELSDLVQKSLSLDENVSHPSFHSVAFNVYSAEGGGDDELDWDELHRVTHVSLSSMLRHLYTFKVDLPVFGVLLKGTRVSLKIGWWEETEDGMVR